VRGFSHRTWLAQERMLDVHGRGGISSRIIEMGDGGATIVRGGVDVDGCDGRVRGYMEI
jgi:hypothetical protein